MTRSVALLSLIASAGAASASTADLKPIEVPGHSAFTENITAGPDGALYVSSFSNGGVQRVSPGSEKAEPWIAPGAYDSRSTFGLYADAKSNTMWVCSNDVSRLGVPGPSQVTGSHLKGFDLQSGEGKVSVPLPGKADMCNDMTIAEDGTLYVTNSLTPQILQLKPGAKAFEVWIEDKRFQPPKGAGLDGIAIGGDGNIYVNTFHGGKMFRIERNDGKPGAVTELKTSRPLTLPDGLRHVEGQTFLMVEGTDKLDRVTIDGDEAKIETVKEGLKGPVGFARIGETIWVAEGQLSHLVNAKEKGPPSLPFQIIPVHAGK